jgi:dissimilatory sulfite reductase (desulfoviridin) alpha/beta subunit
MIYIGKHITNDPNDSYLGSGKHLNRAIKKYGKENFVKEVLHIFDNEDDMNAKEAELVNEEFLLRNDVYNLCPGGQGGFGYINSNNEITSARNKISAINRDNSKNFDRLSNDNRICVLGGMTSKGRVHGFKHSEETKIKIGKSLSLKCKGPNNSQYGSMWITNNFENKKIKKNEIIPIGWRAGRILK